MKVKEHCEKKFLDHKNVETKCLMPSAQNYDLTYNCMDLQSNIRLPLFLCKKELEKYHAQVNDYDKFNHNVNGKCSSQIDQQDCSNALKMEAKKILPKDN